MIEWLVDVSARWVSALMAMISVMCVIYFRRLTDQQKLEERVAAIERKNAHYDARLDQLATKEDLASVKSDVRAVAREVSAVDAGVTRIEQFLMEKGK